jgi:hypothetical protein
VRDHAGRHTSIRGSRIVISSVDFSHTDKNGAGLKTSELRKYAARTTGSQVMLRANFGEGSNLFGQVAQDDRFAYTVHYGLHPAAAFVRIPWSGGAAPGGARLSRDHRSLRQADG